MTQNEIYSICLCNFSGAFFVSAFLFHRIIMIILRKLKKTPHRHFYVQQFAPQTNLLKWNCLQMNVVRKAWVSSLEIFHVASWCHHCIIQINSISISECNNCFLTFKQSKKKHGSMGVFFLVHFRCTHTIKTAFNTYGIVGRKSIVSCTVANRSIPKAEELRLDRTSCVCVIVSWYLWKRKLQWKFYSLDSFTLFGSVHEYRHNLCSLLKYSTK